jgi:transcription elongation factor Elf1
MRYEVECASCRASLEVDVILEPAEAVEAGSDPVRTEGADLITVYCPKCGSRFVLTAPAGVEDVEVRVRG